VNNAHLRTLELDFVDWQKFQTVLDLRSDEEDGNDEVTSTAGRFFAGRIVGLRRRRPRPLLPQLRVLHLTQAPLVAAMAHAINFGTLRSLTLRMYPGWCDFVKTILELRIPLQLITLEIQETDNVSSTFGDSIIQDLLNGFEGLEELFVSQTGPLDTLDLWSAIVRRHPTLRRFVHHQRRVTNDEEAFEFEVEHDIDDLSLYGCDVRIMREDPSRNNRLARLNLECIGLCCLPERLVSINSANLIQGR